MNFRRTLTTSWTKKMKMTRTEPKPMWKFVGHHRPLFRHWDWTRDIGELRPLFCEIRQVYLVRFTWIRLSFLGTVPVILRLTQASGFWGLVLASYSAHARFIGKVSQIFGDLFCPPSSHNVGDWNSIAMNGGRVGVCSLSPHPILSSPPRKDLFQWNNEDHEIWRFLVPHFGPCLRQVISSECCKYVYCSQEHAKTVAISSDAPLGKVTTLH